MWCTRVSSHFWTASNRCAYWLPASVRTLLVRGAVLHVMEQLVEAYSRIQHVGDNTPLIMSSDIHVLKDSLEQLPGLNPLPFFPHVELFTKGFFLPADAPQVIIEWVYQHPFYTPQQVERLVKTGERRRRRGPQRDEEYVQSKPVQGPR